MDLRVSQEDLRQEARDQLRQTIESAQVLDRLRKLLPTMFQDIVQEFRRENFSLAQSQRMALADPRYVNFLERYIQVRDSWQRHRVRADVAFMLIDARASLRVFRRAGRVVRGSR